MKKIIILSIFLFTNYLISQENYNSKSLILKLNSELWSISKLDLKNNVFAISKIDNWLSRNQIKKIIPIGQAEKTFVFQIEFKNEINVTKSIKLLKTYPEIIYVEPDYLSEGGGKKSDALQTPNDALFNRQWGIINNGSFNVSGMPFVSENDADADIDLAWDVETGDPNLIVAVPDTGFRLSHPELSGRIWTNSSEIANDGVDNDNNGLIDDVNGWDYANNDNNATDDYGHGTNCTGILLAKGNNGIGYAGVNWNSKLMPLKVLDANNSGQYSWMANSIYYAVDKGAKIISMSIGGTGNSITLQNAVQYAITNNVVFVACMMNFNNNTTYYPAGYASSMDIIAVGSTDSDDDRTSPFFWSATSGSNYGNHLTLVAPGNYIYGLSHTSDTNYNGYWGGTSQATPLVAGVASLLRSSNPNLTPLQIKNILKNTAQDQVGAANEDVLGFDVYMGWGRVNAYSAFQTLSNLNLVNNKQEFTYKNPIDNKKFEFFSRNYHTNFNLEVYSYDGKLMKDERIIINEGKNEIDFNYPKGNYILVLKNDDYKKTIKIIAN
jgi:subtilisin family serine protease